MSTVDDDDRLGSWKKRCHHPIQPPAPSCNVDGRPTKKPVYIWTCSKCGHRGVWSEGWEWRGRIECCKCGWPQIERVLCPKCAAKRRRSASEAAMVTP